mmetsp:Transcript_12538/g.27679  ORF Transcript_12538/g.27679 Transcript_12538/m.27679 type:complete len:421 (-) Transcript_12538:280-1542(-)
MWVPIKFLLLVCLVAHFGSSRDVASPKAAFQHLIYPHQERRGFASLHKSDTFLCVKQAKGTKGLGGSTSKIKKGGFSSKPPSSDVPPLPEDAKIFLRQHGGDMNAAQASYYRKRLREEEERLLHGPSSSEKDEFDPVQRAAAMKEQKLKLHEAKVIASWDAIAAFLPVDYASRKIGEKKKKPDQRDVPGRFVDSVVRRRLKMIARACFPSDTDTSAVRFLDIGCGDGAAVPFLDDRFIALTAANNDHGDSAVVTKGGQKKKKIYKKKASSADSSYYEGIDVSPTMVEMATYSHSTHLFRVANFMTDESLCHRQYNAILFNGSLQFFLDTAATLKYASSLLAPGGSIVLSHVQGGRFVRDEVKRNPMAGACAVMPTEDELRIYADEMGFSVVGKEEIMGPDPVDVDDVDLEDFYLIVLRKQ